MKADKPCYPFHPWVPRPLGTLLLLLLFVPPTLSGGAYLCNIEEMSGGLGILADDVRLAGFFTSIGMCLFPPFMVRFLQARRPKHTYIRCFLLLIPLNAICATATSLPVLLAACLLTGFVRVAVMLNCTFTIAPYLTGTDTLSMFTLTTTPTAEEQYAMERKRTFLMPVLYFYILLISQLGNWLMAWLAYAYGWQDAYGAVIGMLMAGICLVAVTMPDEKKPFVWQVEWQKVPGMLLMACALCSMAYVLVYGMTQDWLHSDRICLALALMLAACGAFLWLTTTRREQDGYLPPEIFTYRNVWMSMLLFLLTMVFNSANFLAGTFAKLATPINNVQNASLSGWAAAGCLAGLLLSVVMVVRKVRFRTVFCTALLLMAAANAHLYFQYQTMGLLRNLIFSTVLNYTGLLMLYSLTAAFGMKGLPSRHLATYVFLMLWMRNAIAPVVGSCIYATRLNHEQACYVTRLAQNADLVNTTAASVYGQIRKSGEAAGKSLFEAEQGASGALRGRITLQATLAAMKELTGSTVWGITGTACIVFLLPYRKDETT